MQVPAPSLQQSIWIGVTSAASFVGALGCASVLASLDGMPPLLPALAAGLVLAGVEWGLELRSPHIGIEFTANTLASWAGSFLMALVALALVARIVPASVPFVCDPIVPWRISIVFFGAFTCAWIVEGLRLRASRSTSGAADSYRPGLDCAVLRLLSRAVVPGPVRRNALRRTSCRSKHSCCDGHDTSWSSRYWRRQRDVGLCSMTTPSPN